MTATINENDLDTDQIIELDFNLEVKCEEEECSNAAKWKLLLACCKASFLLCQDCIDDFLVFYNDALKSSNKFWVQCRLCGEVQEAADFVESIRRI